MARWLGCAALAIILLGLRSHAAAQQGGEKLRLGAALALDFAGHVSYDPPGNINRFEDSARVSPGLRGHLDYDLHRYLSVGGLVRVQWWRADQDDGHNMLVDVAGRFNVHYDWRDFRFLGVLALGPTFSRLNDDNAPGLDNPGFGVSASFAPGIEWWFERRFGVFTEIFGWSGHFFRHDTLGGGRMQVRLNQVLLQLGMVFAL